jgi:hypothetical protein
MPILRLVCMVVVTTVMLWSGISFVLHCALALVLGICFRKAI